MMEAHRAKVGGGKNWDRLGAFQFGVLVDEGLREEHKLLDIGCGPLRAGKLLIAYLAPGNYFGIDKNEKAIGDGLAEEVPDSRGASLLINEDFRFDKFRVWFDFLLAHSVFGHLDLERIENCFERARGVMTPASKFLFTFKAVEDGTFHRLYDPEALSNLATRCGLTMTLLPYKHSWASHQWGRVTLK